MGFGMGIGMFNIMFVLVFGIVIVMFIVTAVKGIGTWHKNNNSPRLTVNAAVVSKRQNTTVHHHHDSNTGGMHNRSSTTYYATFQFDSGDRLELCVSGREYGLLAEGDVGELTFQGTRYLGFDRRGTAEPASEEPPIRSTEKRSWDPEL